MYSHTFCPCATLAICGRTDRFARSIVKIRPVAVRTSLSPKRFTIFLSNSLFLFLSFFFSLYSSLSFSLPSPHLSLSPSFYLSLIQAQTKTPIKLNIKRAGVYFKDPFLLHFPTINRDNSLVDLIICYIPHVIFENVIIVRIGRIIVSMTAA